MLLGSRIEFTPKGPRRQPGHDLIGARLLLGGRLGIAGEDPLAAGGVGHALGLEGPAHLERRDALDLVLAATRRNVEQSAVGLRESARKKCHRDFVDAGGGFEADILEAFVDRVDGRILLLVDRLEILFTSNGGAEELFSIEHRDDGVLELHVVHPQGARHVRKGQLILAVRGEVVLDYRSATSPERQAVAVVLLGSCSLHGVGSGHGTRASIAQPLTCYLLGRRQVLVHERRGDLQRRGDVVESVVRLIPRQQRRGIDVQIQQIGDRVRILAPVQAMQAFASNLVVLIPRLVECGLEKGDQRSDVGVLGLRLAGRRHQPPPQFAEGLFPDLGIFRHVGHRHAVEGDRAGPVLGVVTLEAVVLDQAPLLGHLGVWRGATPGGQGERRSNQCRYQQPYDSAGVPAERQSAHSPQ